MELLILIGTIIITSIPLIIIICLVCDISSMAKSLRTIAKNSYREGE